MRRVASGIGHIKEKSKVWIVEGAGRGGGEGRGGEGRWGGAGGEVKLQA